MAPTNLPRQRRQLNQRTARVGKNNRAQVVTIPLDFRFPEGVKEVFIRRVGDDIVLSTRPASWADFLDAGVRATDDFMAGIDDLPIQDRHRR